MKLATLILFLFLSSSAFGLEIMAYNVENLFDTFHDEGKDDWAFLPKKTKGKKENCKKINNNHYRKSCMEGDWTEEKLKIKLNQIKQVLTRTREKIPDVLALSEIENKNVVAQLAKLLGYKEYVVSNSADKRGIDLALLYNETRDLGFVNSTEHVLEGEYFKTKPTRNILEVEFKYMGRKLTIFVNHWPSLGNPTETRLIAANTLKNRIQELLKADKGHHIVALGDFNTIPENHPHPFNTVLLKDDLMYDLHTLFMSDKGISWKKKESLPLGTYFYGKKMTWNMLDRIFVSGNLIDKNSLEADIGSFTIYAPDFITHEMRVDKGKHKNSVIVGTPNRYNHKASKADEAGYSDHFPVVIKLKVL